MMVAACRPSKSAVNPSNRSYWPSAKRELDYDIPSVNKAGLVEALTKCCCDEHLCLSRATVEESDHWHRRLLRTGRKGPRRRSTAEQRDKLAALH